MPGNENARIQSIEGCQKELLGQINSADARVSGLEKSIGVVVAKIDALTDPQTKWVMVAAIAAIGSFLVGAFTVIFSYIQYKEHPSMQGQVTRLQADLRMLTVAVAPQLLRELGPLVTDASRLPPNQIGNALRQPTQQLMSLSLIDSQPTISDFNPAVKATATLLRTKPEVAEAWNMASVLVSYRSKVRTPTQPGNLPSCFMQTPHGFTEDSFTIPTAGGVTVKLRIVYENCQIDLSSPIPAIDMHIDAVILPNSILEFRHCTIFYKGGDIPFAHYGPREIIFTESRFNVDVRERPAADGALLLASILDSSPETAIMSSGAM